MIVQMVPEIVLGAPGSIAIPQINGQQLITLNSHLSHSGENGEMDLTSEAIKYSSYDI